MMNRRKFLARTSAAAAAGLILPKLSFAFPKESTIGIQLYSLREMIKDDFRGTLEMLSGTGYNAVEAAGYHDRMFYGYPPSDYRKICDDLGLKPLSSHSVLSADDAGYAAEDALNAGMSYIVIPSVPSEKRLNAGSYEKLADEFNRAGEICKNAGIKMGYHNHAFEFEEMDGQIPYDILLQNTDAGLCFMQADVFWMTYGGADPLDYFNRFPGRFELWHVKDMKDDAGKKCTEIGSGIIDFPALFREREKSGMKYYFVEQEKFEMDPAKSVAISLNYLKSITEGKPVK
ncbi:MAG: sugar phosphate isomerase/epimerase [Bacteroidales bacterium]|nr:sugar phosphate isomerase/epimerase [Bacteroidales bacterium]